MVDLGQVTDLIKRRNELSGEVLTLTEGTVFSRDPLEVEAEADLYADLYVKRDAMVTELTEIHKKIGDDGYALIRKTGGDVLASLTESEERLKRVIELDKRNREFAGEMYETARENIRRINQSRNLSMKYNNEYSSTDGFLVDNKN